MTLTLQVDILFKNMSWIMTFNSERLLIVAIYIWLPPASYVVFLTTLVCMRVVASYILQIIAMLLVVTGRDLISIIIPDEK